VKGEKSGGVVGEEGECGDCCGIAGNIKTNVGYFVREEGSKTVGERDT